MFTAIYATIGKFSESEQKNLCPIQQHCHYRQVQIKQEGIPYVRYNYTVKSHFKPGSENEISPHIKRVLISCIISIYLIETTVETDLIRFFLAYYFCYNGKKRIRSVSTVVSIRVDYPNNSTYQSGLMGGISFLLPGLKWDLTVHIWTIENIKNTPRTFLVIVRLRYPL